jgi:DNA adenine methylase
LTNGDYWDCVKDCGQGDFLYLDPPYLFNGKDEVSAVYQIEWDEAEDRLLADRLKELESRGASWILSNVAESRGRRNTLYDELYEGYKTKEVAYKHKIGAQTGAVNEVRELLVFSN